MNFIYRLEILVTESRKKLKNTKKIIISTQESKQNNRYFKSAKTNLYTKIRDGQCLNEKVSSKKFNKKIGYTNSSITFNQLVKSKV